MTSHLTEDQISRWFVGKSTATEQRHVQNCGVCTAELGQFLDTLETFKAAVSTRAEKLTHQASPNLSMILGGEAVVSSSLIEAPSLLVSLKRILVDTFYPTSTKTTVPPVEVKDIWSGDEFRYTPENQAAFDAIAARYPPDQRKWAIRAALYLAQNQNGGYLTGAAMRHVAEQIRCTPAEVEDVVSYYTMFYTKPVGKYVLNVCRTLSCALLGAERVTEELCAKLGIHPGQTTSDGEFTVIEVECLGACDRAPVVMVNDDWHERLAPEQAGAFVDDIKKRGRAAFTGCHLHVEKK
jgi:NADH-quinone oxidoreductase E subunit